MSRSVGTWGEAQVANYLRQRKFRLVAHSYRCRFGEIDLIAMDGNTLCFIEVKTLEQPGRRSAPGLCYCRQAGAHSENSAVLPQREKSGLPGTL